MKKVLFATFVIATIASCTKNDVIPVENDSLEIKFQTVVGPQTKALGQVEYAGDAFYSTAFYLDKAKNWAANSGDAVVYLQDKIISSGTPKTWAAATPYYWPKNGRLTFMSYALLDDSKKYVDATSLVTTANSGLTISSFNVDTYKNYDLLVADIAEDKSANQNVYLTSGVPTLFGHKLCKLVIKAQTAIQYPKQQFHITSITINQLDSQGTYTMTATGTEKWTGHKNPVDVTFFSDPSTPVEVNNDDVETTQTEIPAAQSVYLPQNFQDSETITVNYTITTTTPSSSSVVETVSVTKKLSDVFTLGWEMNKIYILDLTFALDTILWDPAQTDWTNGANGSMSL